MGNSGLPSSWVGSLAFDAQGNLWIGTGGGLARFDGERWEVYDTGSSGLPDNRVLSLAVDFQGSLWIGTARGLARFDGKSWQVYDTGNSGLPGDLVRSLALDAQGNLWIGTARGLAKFDGESWQVYSTGNSGLPDNGVGPLAFDSQGNLWLGAGGLAKFDGESWEVYDTGNSGLPQNSVRSLAVDSQGNVWIGTSHDVGGGGLAVYREGGLILPGATAVAEELDTKLPSAVSLSQNYPNPFNSSTTIRFALPISQDVELSLFNLVGQKVATLLEGVRQAGTYRMRWDGRDDDGRRLASGVYLYRLRTGDGPQVETRKLALIR